QVDEVEVAGEAVHGGVHVHGRDHDPVVQLHGAQPEGVEHGRPRGGAGRLPGGGPGRLPRPVRRDLSGEPLVHARDELGVAQAQVVVGDPAAAGEQVEGELDRCGVDVAGDVLEPLQAGPCGALGTGHDGAAFVLVGGQGRLGGGLFVQAGGEGEGVLHGQFGARPDGEVGGVGGVAEQDHVAATPG